MARRSLGFVFRRDGGERILGDEGAGCVQTEFTQTIRLRPVGCRAARPQGVLLGLFLSVSLARMASTECREAPRARRKGSSLLLPSQLQLSSAERHPRDCWSRILVKQRELFDQYPPARGQCKL